MRFFPAGITLFAEAKTPGGITLFAEPKTPGGITLFAEAKTPGGIITGITLFAEAKTPGGITITGLTGLEPATSRVTGERSNQLSYNPNRSVGQRGVMPLCRGMVKYRK